MAHMVEKMFSVRDTPWHYSLTGPDKTTLLDSYPETWEAARTLAGLDWDPIEEAPFRRKIVINDETGQPEEQFEQVHGFKWITRSDTGLILDSAVDSYEMITNSDMGDIIETFMSGHKIQFVTGGCLDEGRKVWAMLQMGDLLEIKGDPSPTARYVALLNTHDGHGACKAIATNVRIVCANTWHYADTTAEAQAACFSFHHRANWRQHMKDLQADVVAALSGADKEMKAYAELADEMITKKVTLEQELRFVDEFIFPTREEHKLKPQALENVRTSRSKVWGLLESKSCDGIRGTAYGLLQAGGEYLDHERAYKNHETYLNRTVFSKEKMKLRAKNIAEMAAQGVL
ncbi:DUF932 domain-containing protein [Streptomyces sp. NPDC051907]|uniref:DUF932 domain-containing protein n=1 Tax=Streptomyces sp. NPDC051907 TaxID=3155284 RepID=UPI00341DB636